MMRGERRIEDRRVDIYGSRSPYPPIRINAALSSFW